jgi:hypothetical protein
MPVLIVMMPLIMGAAAVLTAVFWGTRTPRTAPKAIEAYDSIDYVWLQNTVIMPELSPVPYRQAPRFVRMPDGQDSTPARMSYSLDV